MKIVNIEDNLPLNLENVKNVLFGDGSFLALYHEARKDFDLVIGDWEPEENAQKRVVTFQAPFQAPAVVAKFFKANVTNCSVDEVLWFDAQNRMIVTNESKLSGIPMAESFRTSARWTFTQRGQEETHMALEVQVEFSGRIFGVGSAVEAAMKGDAEPSFRQWVELAKQVCTNRAMELKKAPLPPPSPFAMPKPSRQMSETASHAGSMKSARSRGYASDSGSEFDNFFETKSDLEGYPQDDEESDGEHMHSEPSHTPPKNAHHRSLKHKSRGGNGSGTYLAADILAHNDALLALRDEVSIIKDVASQTDARTRALEQALSPEGVEFSIHQCLRQLEDIYNRSARLQEETKVFEAECQQRIDQAVQNKGQEKGKKTVLGLERRHAARWAVFGFMAGVAVLGVPALVRLLATNKGASLGVLTGILSGVVAEAVGKQASR